MNDRPVLDRNLDSKTFRDYYYLKEELVSFCRENGIPVSGGKIEITDRIAYFLDTGKILPAPAERKKATAISVIREDTEIEANFVCSEKHRAFFKENIGSSFSFNVGFQKWLKSNRGKSNLRNRIYNNLLSLGYSSDVIVANISKYNLTV